MNPTPSQQAASAAATPKTTTIERIARALCLEDGNSPDLQFVDRHGKQQSWPWWKDYLPPAQAALQALRQVDEGTVEAMDRDNPVTWPWDYEATCEDRTDTLRAAFTAAIDHILSQGGEG